MTVRKLSIIILLALLTFNTLPATAALSVTPAVIELTLENGQATGSFTVSNTGKAPMRIRASYIHFKLDAKGKIGPAPLDSTSLSNYLRVSPLEFAIQPEGSRQIRFAVSVPQTLPDGSYWGGLEFRPVTERDTSSVSTIRGVMGIMVPILADKGKPTYVWEIVPDSMYSDPTSKGVYVYSLLRSSGNGRIPHRGMFQLKNSAGEIVYSGETTRLSLFPNSQRYFPALIPAEVPSGTYDFSITYTSDMDKSSVSGATRVEIPETLPSEEVRGGRHEQDGQ